MNRFITFDECVKEFTDELIEIKNKINKMNHLFNEYTIIYYVNDVKVLCFCNYKVISLYVFEKNYFIYKLIKSTSEFTKADILVLQFFNSNDTYVLCSNGCFTCYDHKNNIDNDYYVYQYNKHFLLGEFMSPFLHLPPNSIELCNIVSRMISYEDNYFTKFIFNKDLLDLEYQRIAEFITCNFTNVNNELNHCEIVDFYFETQNSNSLDFKNYF